MKQHSYWYTISHARIAILGICPPPLGGVSVHINRVMDSFSLQNNRVFFWSTEKQRQQIFFIRYILRLFWWLIKNRPTMVYYHSTYLTTAIVELFFITLLGGVMKYQLHIVDHDCRHLYRRTRISKRIYRWIITRAAAVICIGQVTYQSYSDHALNYDHVRVDDAFIPPAERNAALIMSTYPSSLQSFLVDNTPLILFNAAYLMRDNNRDMYGMDTAIHLLHGIQDEFPDAGLLIGLPRIGDDAYFAVIQQLMQTVNVAEHIYILHENKEIWPLFAKIDLFLRPTLTDGDSISVREALYFKIPVVASDICMRPAGVYTYKTGNCDDAIFVTKKVLRDYVYGAQRQHYHLHP